MANTIKIRRSAVQGAVPTTGQLQLGELALNTYDGKLYTKKDNGTASIVELSPNGLTDVNIASNAEIAVSKLADGAARQLLQTDAAGTGVEWTSNVDIPGTLDVTSAATFDSTLSFPLGSAALPSIYPGTDTNTGFWSPAADTVAVSTGGSERLRVDGSGKVGIGTSSVSASEFFKVVDPSTGALTFGDIFEYGGPVLGVNGTVSNPDAHLLVKADGAESTNGTGFLTADYTSGVFRIGTYGSPITFDPGLTGERARIDSSGNFGINTSSPGSTLDVKGTLRLSGSTSGYVGLAPAAAAGSTTYTLPSADGTSGQVLSTNGSGTLSWAAASGGVSDGDKGDITVSASGATWTVDNDAITYAKIQNVSATDKLLGRSTAGAGDIEEITCTAAGRALLDDADAAAQRTTLSAAGSGAVTGSGLTMATARILGRSTASTGAIEEISVGAGLSLSGGTLSSTVTTEISFTIPGNLTVGAAAIRWYFTGNVTVSNVVATVSTAPTGASVIFDVNKNGSTIFTTQGNRPTITATNFTDLTSTPDTTTFASGDYVTIDVDQIGSTVAGADAVIRLVVS